MEPTDQCCEGVGGGYATDSVKSADEAAGPAQDEGGERDGSGSDEEDPGGGVVKKRHRKYAVWCSYVGAGYHVRPEGRACAWS